MTDAPPTSQRADATVLVVEDDRSLATVLSSALGARVERVHVVPTGAEGLRAASDHEPDVVVLDLGLPDIDGLEVCRELRRWYRNPIIVLTADGDESRKVTALEDGADDYVTKPFSMPELLARIGVALRHRAYVEASSDTAALEIGDLRIDPASYDVTVAGRAVALSKLEFELLLALARRPGRVVTYAKLRSDVWSGDQGSVATMRTRAASIRAKLGAGDRTPRISSQPGIGYRLALPDESFPSGSRHGADPEA